MGLLQCHDKLFPEAARALAGDGAGIIACPAAWPADRHRPARVLGRDRQTLHFDAVDRARAIESHVVWVSANLAGRWGRLRFLGRAKVVCPDGHILAATGHRAGMAVARVNPAAAIAASRAYIDHLADRRPAAYAASPPTNGVDAAPAPAPLAPAPGAAPASADPFTLAADAVPARANPLALAPGQDPPVDDPWAALSGAARG